MSPRMLLVLAGVVGLLGVAIGAFGSHMLPNILKDLSPADFLERKEWLEIGARYHLIHAVAMLAIGLASSRGDHGFGGAGIAWLIGICIFSGCLYAMSITGIRVLGAIVPIGGVSLMIGWGLIVAAALRHTPPQ